MSSTMPSGPTDGSRAAGKQAKATPPAGGLAAFLLLTFALTWAVEIGLVRRYPLGSVLSTFLLLGVMLIPGLCAVAVRVWVERSGFADSGLRWGRGRHYLAAWLLPAAFGVAAMGLAIAFRQAEFDPYMTELMVRIRRQAPAMELPPFERLRVYFIVGAMTQAVVLNTVFAFGEEFGWRGYLLMRLLPLGAGRAMALTGAIWGLWHAPIILQGHNFPDHPLVGVPLMVTYCVLMGMVLGWLRLASGSVLPAAVAHASVNGPGSAPLAFLRSRNDLTTGLTGLLGQAVLLVFALALWRLGALRIRNLESEKNRNATEKVPEPEGQ